MNNLEAGPLASYNSLTDPNLSGFFANRRLRQHLRKSGLVTRDGRVVSETTYRMYWTKREQQQQMHEILANAILNKTLDMERTRQAEIRKKIDEISKIELVRRMREEKDINRRENTLPLLTPRTDSHSARSRDQMRRPNSQKDSKSSNDRRRTQSAGASRTSRGVTRSRSRSRSQSGESDISDIVSRDSSYESRDQKKRPMTSSTRRSAHNAARETPSAADYSPYREVPAEAKGLVPAPPRTQRTSAPSARRNVRRIQSAKQSQTSAKDDTTARVAASPVVSLSKVKIHYFGPSLKLDTSVDFDSHGDMITVEQQPAGSGTHIVFKDFVKRGSEFSFESRRHRIYPFSLTLYVNGQQNCRLSACCEYKHKSGSRLGGMNGHFGIVSVTGPGPCYRCQFNEDETKEEKKKRKANKKGKSESDKKNKKKQDAVNREDGELENGNSRNRRKKKQGANDVMSIPVDDDDYNEDRAYDDDFEDTGAKRRTSSTKSATPDSVTPRNRSDSDTARSANSDTVKSTSSVDDKPKNAKESSDGARDRSSDRNDHSSLSSDRSDHSDQSSRSGRSSRSTSPHNSENSESRLRGNKQDSGKRKSIDSPSKERADTRDDVEAVRLFDDIDRSEEGENNETLDAVNTEESGQNIDVNAAVIGELNEDEMEKRNDEDVERFVGSDEQDYESKIETGINDNESVDLFEGWDKSDEDANEETQDKANNDELERRDDEKNDERQVDERRGDDEDVERRRGSGDQETSKSDDDQFNQILGKFTNIIKNGDGNEEETEETDDNGDLRSEGDQQDNVDRRSEDDQQDNGDRRSENAELDAENAEIFKETFRVFGQVSQSDENDSEKNARENEEPEINETESTKNTNPMNEGNDEVGRPINEVDSRPVEGSDSVSVSGDSCSDSDCSGSSSSSTSSSTESDDESEKGTGDKTSNIL